jgi:hypothetical protein
MTTSTETTERRLDLWERLRLIANRLNTADDSEEMAFLIARRQELEAELKALDGATA